MPYMISDKPLHIAHNGVDARFQAGVERFVRPSLQPVAEQHGARVVDEVAKQVASSDDAPTDEQVHQAMRELLEAGDMSAFGADDLPKVRELSKRVGQKVSAKQRDRVWEQTRE